MPLDQGCTVDRYSYTAYSISEDAAAAGKVLWRKDPGPHSTGSGRMVPAKNVWLSQRGLDRTHL
jgi:hypothetical protein